MQCRILLYTFLFTFVSVLTRSEIKVSELWNTHAIPLSRYYSVTRCLFNVQGGYTCRGCSTALHCYPTNDAIQVECRGLFPYCHNGFCSLRRGAKCVDDKVTESLPTNVTTDISITSHKPLTNENSTLLPVHEHNVPIQNNLTNVIQETTEVHNTENTISYEDVPLQENNASVLEQNISETESNNKALSI